MSQGVALIVSTLLSQSDTTLVQIYDGTENYKQAILCTSSQLKLPTAILAEPSVQTDWAFEYNISVYIRPIHAIPERYKKWALKLMLWSLPLKSVLFLDTDVFIFDKLKWLLALHRKNPNMVIMAPERASGFSVNSGLMVFSPNMTIHYDLQKAVHKPLLLPPHGDQEIITTFFGQNNLILQLGPMWGVRLQINGQGQITGGSWNAHQWRQIAKYPEFFPYAIHYGSPKPWENVTHNPLQHNILSKYRSLWCNFSHKNVRPLS